MSSTVDRAPVAGIRARLDAELLATLQCLKQSGRRFDLHEARKHLKRARALVRLLRDAFGETVYRKLNVALRNSARPLSQARDAQVLLQTLAQLTQDKQRPGLKLARLRADLKREERQHQAAVTTRVSTVSGRIWRTRQMAQRVHAVHLGWQPIGIALRRTYRRGRRAQQEAGDDGTAEQLHEWRKQAKYSWHQMEALQPTAPKAIGEKIKHLHELSDLLGDDHDLFVLQERIAHTNAVGQQERDRIRSLSERQRKRLQRKAVNLGARIYSSSPKRVQRKFARYWRT